MLGAPSVAVVSSRSLTVMEYFAILASDSLIAAAKRFNQTAEEFTERRKLVNRNK